MSPENVDIPNAFKFSTLPLSQQKQRSHRFNKMKRDVFDSLPDKHSRYMFLKIELDTENGNVNKVSEILDVSRNTVKEVRLYMLESKSESPRLGRPQILTSAAKLFISTVTFTNP